MSAVAPDSLLFKWEAALESAGFKWPSNESARLLRASLNISTNFTLISEFFIKRSQQMFMQSSCLNQKLFFLLSSEMGYLPPALAESEDMKEYLAELHAPGSMALSFFKTYLLASKRQISGRGFEMYLDVINGATEKIAKEEFVIAIPPWVFAFIFYFDDDVKETLACHEQAQLFTANEIDSLPISDFHHIDLGFVGLRLCEKMTEIIIYFEREKDEIHSDPNLLIEHYKKPSNTDKYLPVPDGFDIESQETQANIVSFLSNFSKDLKSIPEADKINVYLKKIFTDQIEDFENGYDFAQVPVRFAYSVKPFLLFHTPESRKKTPPETSFQLYQSLLRADKLISGYKVTPEDTLYTPREIQLGRDIANAMDLQKKIFKEEYPDVTDIPPMLHIIQHMANVMRVKDNMPIMEFTKLLIDIKPEAAWSFLFAIYVGIDNIYDWFFVYKGFTNGKKYTTIYMEDLKKEHEKSLQKASSSSE